MRSYVKIFVAAGVIAFITIQFFQPVKNISSEAGTLTLNHPDFPENVKTILKNACLDCHSNNTNYPWYDKIAPVSWMVNKHVKDGKKQLNFTEWNEFDKFQKINVLEDIRQELEQETMPLKPYVMMHKEAKLTDENKKLMYAWIDKLGTGLLTKQNVE